MGKQRAVDFAGPHFHRVSRHAMVAGMVSGRRTGWRRIRSPAHVQRQGRKEFAGFNIAHYALRPWPWIVTALVAIVVYSPNGGLQPSAAFAANPEQGYVMVLR